MKKKIFFRISTILLALVFSFVLFFLTIEIPVILNEYLLKVNIDFPFSNFIDTMYFFRLIGYFLLIIIIGLIIVGFIVKKTRISFFGSFLLFLPTFGQFVIGMSFLAGIGLLYAIWLPLGNPSLWIPLGGDPGIDVLDLGHVINLPIMFFDVIFNIFSVDILSYYLRISIIFLGFFIFFLGVLAWFSEKRMNHKVFTSSIYKFSRHPQYLGYLVWSYGVHTLSIRQDPIFMGMMRISYSLPWLISALIIVCVALFEDIKMQDAYPEKYDEYRKNTQFLLPLPKFVRKILVYPFKIIYNKEFPEYSDEIVITFIIYGIIGVIISFILILCNIDPLNYLNWAEWWKTFYF